MSPDSRKLAFTGVQGLRAVAALMVVAYHALEGWNQRAGHTSLTWSNGSAGVDLFFVISGFVMATATRNLTGGWRDARYFLWLRLTRIVPLYWFFSIVKLAAVLAVPALVLRTQLNPGFVTHSLLFLPVHDAAGDFKPLLPVGWTLTFEMLFYTLFALALALRLAVMWAVPPVLLFLALLPHTVTGPLTDLCNPLLLEFGLGMLIAQLLLLGIPTGRWLVLTWLTLALGLTVLLTIPAEVFPIRVLSWGLAACLTVDATVTLEPFFARYLPRFVRRLGDASYAIYLPHGFVVALLTVTLPYLPANSATAALWVTAVLLTSTLVGYLVYILMEQPLLRWFNRMRKKALVEALSI
jgi:exopolysaccharide production protein ExoZ